MSFQALPNEIFLEVANYLDFQDCRSLLYTNRRYSQVISMAVLNFAVIWCNCSLSVFRGEKHDGHRKDVKTAECGYALTALHLGIINGDGYAVKFLLERIPSIKIALADRVLYTRIAKDESEMASELLLKEGAASKVQCKICGNTALHYAANYGHEVMVKRLLDHGVVDCEGSGGYRALHCAASKGYENIVRHLVLKASSEKDYTHSGDTALHIAAQNGHLNVVKTLLDEFKWDINAQNGSSQTALHISAATDNRKLAKLLLERGANTTIQDANLFVAAEVAYDVEANHPTEAANMVKLIESYSLTKLSPDGETPLHRAVRNGCMVMVRRLLNSGEPKDIQNKLGYTPLHLAAEFDEEIAFELLNRGADDSLENHLGLRAIDIAKLRAKKVYLMMLGLGCT